MVRHGTRGVSSSIVALPIRILSVAKKIQPMAVALFRLPVYHVENFLLEEEAILSATKQMLGMKCPFSAEPEVTQELQRLALTDQHLLPYTKAVLDAEISRMAKQAHNAVWKNQLGDLRLQIPGFDDTKTNCKNTLANAIADGTWRSRVKGQDLLKAYCSSHGLKYEHFRNSIISSMIEPPPQLLDIIKKIDVLAGQEPGALEC
jgi:hypothetical protein